MRFNILVTLVFALAACGPNRHKQYESPTVQPTPHVSLIDLHVAIEGSAHADALRDCVLPLIQPVRTIDCPLSLLPLLADEGSVPSVDAIMNRVAVSHQWMTPRLRSTLEALPIEVLVLFRPVVGIVAHSQLGFSRFREGVIFLDGALLCATPAECAEASAIDPRETNIAGTNEA